MCSLTENKRQENWGRDNNKDSRKDNWLTVEIGMGKEQQKKCKETVGFVVYINLAKTRNSTAVQ